MVWQKESKFIYEIFLEKHKIILVFFALLFILLSVRLFYLQILKGTHYRKVSDQQRMYNTHERAPRGIIYSDNGSMMVGNDFTYVALFYPFEQQETPSDETIEQLSKILKRDIKPTIDRGWRYGRVVKLADNLTMEEMFKIQEKKLILSGISVVKEPRRVYFYPEQNSHVTGYTGEINAEEVARLYEQGYKPGDYVGRGGIEQYYDRFLQGTDGGWQLEVNAKGNQTRAFKYIHPEIGASVHSTISQQLQNAAYDALKNSATGRGAVVVLDTKTGAVKALVSLPGFDTNKAGTREFAKYLKDKDLPLFNRALQALYPPGSIFKIVTFAAAVELLDINLKETEICTGSFELGDRWYACWLKSGHGRVNLIAAMAQSCNIYFYDLALKLGVRNIERFARKFYLGERTGIDLPNEKKGFIPNPEWKKMKTKMSWLQGDTLIFAIGQGALSVTPIQMADMITAVANRGVYLRPYIVDNIINIKGEEVFKHTVRTRDTIELSEETWDLLYESLVETVENGTGRRSKLSGIKVAGKTGTAQNPHGENHAWFVTFAPADNPEIAIAVIVEAGGGGGLNAVPVARKIYESYFGIEDIEEEAVEKPKRKNR
ncbi:MAG: penicillin-binding protein 2 [Endomicrobia bacterium]|nr:penicillin-binding protein 2 [Endomicrobiia bacterium]MCL2507009.1 penicillin-binding protein 2 [Endomicrobiia bacterium]